MRLGFGSNVLLHVFCISFALLQLSDACEFGDASQEERTEEADSEMYDVELKCQVPAGCRTVWFFENELMQFENGRYRKSVLIQQLNNSLQFLRTTQSQAGRYACALRVPECNATSPLACYPKASVRFINLTVHPFIQPSTEQLMPLFPPEDSQHLVPGKLYLSRLVNQAKTLTRRVFEDGRPIEFRADFMTYRTEDRPAVYWYKVTSDAFDGVDPTNYEIEPARLRRCQLKDTMLQDDSGFRCYTSVLKVKVAGFSSFGVYGCNVTLSRGSSLTIEAFRLDQGTDVVAPWPELEARAKARAPAPMEPQVKFVSDMEACSGVALRLDCSVQPAYSTVSIVRVHKANGTFRVLHRYWPRRLLIRDRPVAVSSHGDSARVSVTLEGLGKEDSGEYACVAQTSKKGRAVVRKAVVVVKEDCGILPNSSVRAAVIAASVGLVAFLVVSGVICCHVIVRRRHGPIVKRLRVIHSPTDHIYNRNRVGSGTAPLLSHSLSRRDSQESAQTVQSSLVPEVVVERLGRQRDDTTTGNREVRYIIPKCPVMEVDRKNVYFCKKIGEGAFGAVYAGQIHCGSRTIDVAIKRLKQDYTEEELLSIVKEMEIMKVMAKSGIQHPNVIKMLGVCTKKGPFLLLTELAHLGNLRDFLRERRPLCSSSVINTGYSNLKPGSHEIMVMPVIGVHQLVCFSLDVASAMEFLASKGIVHRDLAARNVLVARAEYGDGVVAKVADFGLTRNVEDKDYYRMLTEGKLPVKWLAPECLSQRVFSEKSDVWAFGILLYEIFSFGEIPYPGIPPDRVFREINQGLRNRKPVMATQEAFELMCSCWQKAPHERPTFEEVVNRIRIWLFQPIKA